VAQEYRYMPPVAEMIRMAHEGAVGVMHQVAIREHREPFYPKVGDWNRFSANTGGTLVEKCCHYFNLMDLILKEKPQRVFASGGQRVNHLDEDYGGRRPDILDSAYVVVEYPSGARALLDLCMFAEGSMDNEHIVVVGDEGRLESLLPSLQLRHSRREDWGNRAVWGQASGTGRGVAVRRVWDTNIRYPRPAFRRLLHRAPALCQGGARGPAGRDHAGGGPAQRHHRPGRAPFDRHRPAGAAQRTAAARLVMSDSPVCELRAGALRAAVRPDLGASLAGLWWQDEPLLRSCEPGLLAGAAAVGLLRAAALQQPHRPLPLRLARCAPQHPSQLRRSPPLAARRGLAARLDGDGAHARAPAARPAPRTRRRLAFRLFGHPGAAAQRRRARVAHEPAQLRRPRTAGRPGLASLFLAPRRQPFADARGGPLGAG
jgi:predicted dehydrogenase